MRQNRRLGGIKALVFTAAGILLMQAFGSAVTNAQRRLGEDSDLLKADRQVRQPAVVPTVPQKGTQIARPLPGSNPPGIIIRAESFPSGSTLVATAGPTSNCVLNPGPQPASGFTCNIFEADASGNPSEISNVITLPNVVVGGFVVLKENGAIADSDTTNWSDVLKFGDGTNANTTSIQLFSAGCNTSNPNDRSCFPPYSPATSAFVVETKPGPTVFSASPNIYNIYSVSDHPPDRPWTSAGSTGTVDEDSTAIVQLRNFTATFLPGATGSVRVRYNITAVDGISRFCPATLSIIRARFRNSDNSGTTAKVTFEIHSTNITSGGNLILYTFSSNGRGAGSAFTSATDNAAIDFDFSNNVYWIEGTIFRTDPGQFADLGSIQIWEASGTPCP